MAKSATSHVCLLLSAGEQEMVPVVEEAEN